MSFWHGLDVFHFYKTLILAWSQPPFSSSSFLLLPLLLHHLLLQPPFPVLLLLLLLLFLIPTPLPWHYSPLCSALDSITRNVHSLLSEALVLHLVTYHILKSNSTLSIHLNLGLAFFSSVLLVCLPVSSLLYFHNPFFKKMPKSVQSKYFSYY